VTVNVEVRLGIVSKVFNFSVSLNVRLAQWHGTNIGARPFCQLSISLTNNKKINNGKDLGHQVKV
jgi:hypothetical protein